MAVNMKKLIAVLMLLGILCGLVSIPATAKPTPENGFQLLRACLDGNLNKAKELLDQGASPDYLCKSFSPLIIASLKGHTEIVQLLLEKGADVNLRTENGPTALMEASARGHADIVKTLLDKGAEVNAKATFIWVDIKITGNSCQELKEPGAVEELCYKDDCCMTALCVATDAMVRQMLMEQGGTE
jgi:ankyrin repeat protein